VRAWRRLLLGAALVSAAAGSADAKIRLFSYDPANQVTERTAGDLTFEFSQTLIFVKVLRIHSTEGHATAEVKPADEKVLGRGGLARLIGNFAPERDLYAVEPQDEGADMTAAFCPGSTQAWVAVGHIAENRPLNVWVLGDDPKGGPARVCAKLSFTFHGEWRAPDDSDIEHNQERPPQGPSGVPGPS
jgi:hypothetical protein